MTTDSTDATTTVAQTFSAASGQTQGTANIGTIGNTVYSASATMRNSETTLKTNQVVVTANIDPKKVGYLDKQ